MKNYKRNIILLLVTISITSSLIAQEDNSKENTINEDFVDFVDIKDTHEEIKLDEKTGFPLILKKPFPIFDYGLTTSIVTRITKQTKRSNFVDDHYFIGAYVAMQSRNMEPLDSMIRISIYYPVAYKFNKVPNAISNMLNFGIDLFAAPYVNLSLWHYLTFDLGGGLHFLFEQSDDYNFVNLGLGAFARINMPVARRWTMFVDGYFSLDYGNLGTNGPIEPVDFVWQYQVAVGFRYSKKAPNKYSYIPSRRTFDEDIQILAEKQQAKIDKKEAKEEEKALKNAEKEAEKEAKEAAKQVELDFETDEIQTENDETESSLDITKIKSVLDEDVDSFEN